MSNLSTNVVLPVILGLLLSISAWPLKWLISGAPILTYLLVLGGDNRILPFIPFWTLCTILNLLYALSATSWLFYWIFLLACYPTIFLTSLFQFSTVAKFTRRRLSTLLKQLHFVNDKVAFFNIPALEIDTEVQGLMVIRGITISLSDLSLKAHGVEVGIKLSEDMEFAVQVDEVQVFFFRRIEVGDVYCNLKGGEFEMTFGNLARRETGDSLMVSDTPLLQAAALHGNTARPDLFRITSKMTNGSEPQEVSVKDGLKSLDQIPVDGDAEKRYHRALAYIDRTSSIQEAIRSIDADLDPKELRATICSQLHDKPSVPHPPLRSIKVTTLQNLAPLYVRRYLHRMPFLLRLLLNPLSYFHPVKLQSVTAGGSGKWLQSTLSETVFKHYGQDDSGIRKLERRVSAWLSDANFLVQLAGMTGEAHVPLNSNFKIVNQLEVDDLLAYRASPKDGSLRQVVRVGGADASIAVPSFLLPHHEHLLPAVPTQEDREVQRQQVEEADPVQEVKAQAELERTLQDETDIMLSVHARLPAVFDQDLLDFIAALVKAAKIIEMGKDPESDDLELPDSPSKPKFRDFAVSLGTNMKEGIRRAGIDAVANDKWIAKLVGKATKRLESALGEVGYSGVFQVPLAPYRTRAETDLKLLP